MNSVFLALLVACVAGLAQGFVPTSLGSVAEVQRQNYRLQALNVRMQGEGRTDRRSILLRGALPEKCHIVDLPSAVCYRFDENHYRSGGVLAVLPLITAAPASAQFGGIPNPADLIGNPRGDRPGGLGPIGRYLSLCDSENCVSTSDDVYRYFCAPQHSCFKSACKLSFLARDSLMYFGKKNHSKRYLPPWTFNNEGETDKDEEEAMEELVAVVKNFKGAKIIKQTDNYLYAEFERELGFVDDVEFLIKTDDSKGGGGAGTVEYRSAARKSKKSDHRSRIKALRLELQKKGWKSVGYR